MYICTYSTNYSITLIIIIVIIIHTIQYICTTTIYIPNMIFVYIILCHVKRLYYTPTLVYITLCYTMCIYALSPHCDIWLCTITSHTTLIYYTINYYDNSNCFLFLLLWLIELVYVFEFALWYFCFVSLECALLYVCPRICSYMCICVCLPRLTLLGCAVVKRLICWHIGGGIFREKIFTKFGKWVYHVKTDRKSIFDLEKR